MQQTSIIVDLFEDPGAQGAFAIKVDGEKAFRAEKGFGANFKKVWRVEIESPARINLNEVDWDTVLERALEAYEMSDPVITQFEWPIGK